MAVLSSTHHTNPTAPKGRVEEDLCMRCGTPAAVAPHLVGMNSEHCYFKRQPESAAEVEGAIKAVESCCCGAYRYRGTDADLIRRLGIIVSDRSGDH